MRRLLTALLLVAGVVLSAQAQWTYSKSFLPTSLKYSGNGIHGVAVDPAGKIWVIPYDVSDSVVVASTGKYAKTRAIYVFNKDGTSVDTIKTIVVNSVRDTLYNSSRGISTDYQGNILYASFDVLYKINYQTRAGMAKLQPTVGNTLTACQTDSLGEVFTSFVLDGVGPMKIYGSNFSTFIGNVIDTTRGFARNFAVSKSGNDVYWAGYTNGFVNHWHSNNGSLGPYTLADSALKGFHAESFAWNPKGGLLWVSAGSLNDFPDGKYFPRTWYAYNTTTKTIVDGFHWQDAGAARLGARPRGIAFSVTGDTAYVCSFNIDSSGVEVFTRTPTSVEKLPDPVGVVSGYALQQNYPNPFNPTTQIQFTLAKPGLAQLFIYDIVGRDVATLVNKDMGAGTFVVTFNASTLPSGTYFYELRSGEARIVKKMTLLK